MRPKTRIWRAGGWLRREEGAGRGDARPTHLGVSEGCFGSPLNAEHLTYFAFTLREQFGAQCPPYPSSEVILRVHLECLYSGLCLLHEFSYIIYTSIYTPIVISYHHQSYKALSVPRPSIAESLGMKPDALRTRAFMHSPLITDTHDRSTHRLGQPPRPACHDRRLAMCVLEHSS